MRRSCRVPHAVPKVPAAAVPVPPVQNQRYPFRYGSLRPAPQSPVCGKRRSSGMLPPGLPYLPCSTGADVALRQPCRPFPDCGCSAEYVHPGSLPRHRPATDSLRSYAGSLSYVPETIGCSASDLLPFLLPFFCVLISCSYKCCRNRPARSGTLPCPESHPGEQIPRTANGCRWSCSGCHP